MKLAAIICEFNPLHTGHKRLIDYAKSISDKVVCIMSGNFTQRGLPACADKYSRAVHALMAGADAVVEMPTVFATSAAENFAFGGVSIAAKLGADFLVFGSECGDLPTLNRCADVIENTAVQEKIKQEIAKGVSYPKALALATGLAELDKPNNTLSIEYLRAIRKTGSSITPLTIIREDNRNENTPLNYVSSSCLRKNKELLAKYSFDFVEKSVSNGIENIYCELAPIILSVTTKEQLRTIEGVSEGLENRIFNADKSMGYDRMIEEIKTKRYTRLKLQRIVLHTILNITKEYVLNCKTEFPTFKMLATKQNAVTLIPRTDGKFDETTKRADCLYSALGGKKPPRKLIVIDD